MEDGRSTTGVQSRLAAPPQASLHGCIYSHRFQVMLSSQRHGSKNLAANTVPPNQRPMYSHSPASPWPSVPTAAALLHCCGRMPQWTTPTSFLEGSLAYGHARARAQKSLWMVALTLTWERLGSRVQETRPKLAIVL